MKDCKHDVFTDTCGTCWFKKGMNETNSEKRINYFKMALIVYETKVNTLANAQKMIQNYGNG